MKYILRSTGSVLLPKLIGSYENELFVVWETISKKRYASFIDVGAAEGYYAVGLTKYVFKDNVPCVAFETTTKGQQQIRTLAQLNQVNNISINGLCDTESLNKALSTGKCFLLVDIEGGEMELLDPVKSTGLNYCDILVELHPNIFPTIRETLISRFSETHSIVEFPVVFSKELPAGLQIPVMIRKYGSYLLNEFRTNQSWLFLQANTGAS